MGLNTIKGTGNWGGAASDLNNNFASITAEVEKLKAANVKFKGYYTTELTLKAAHPSPTVGDTAWVGETYPGVVYRCDVAGTWLATTDVPPSNTVNLSEYATQDAVSKELASVRSDLNIIDSDVNNRIDLISGRESEELDLSSIVRNIGVLTGPQWGGFNAEYNHIVIKVKPNKKYTLVNNSSETGSYAFLKTYTAPVDSSSPVNFCQDTTKMDLAIGETIEITIPSDCNFLYITATAITDRLLTISTTKIEGILPTFADELVQVRSDLNIIDSDVNNRIDLISGRESEELDLSSIVRNIGVLTGPQWGGFNAEYNHIVIKVKPNKKYTLVNNSSGTGSYAFLESYSVPINTSSPVYFCQDTTKMDLAIGETIEITIPSDCNFLYITATAITDRLLTVSTTKIEGVLTEFDDKINELAGDINGDLSELALSDYVEIVGLIAFGKWSSSGAYKFVLIPVKGMEKYYIKANESLKTDYAYLKSDAKVIGSVADFCDGYNSTLSVAAGKSSEITTPSDCKFIYVLTLNDFVNAKPEIIRNNVTGLKYDVDTNKNKITTLESEYDEYGNQSIEQLSNVVNALPIDLFRNKAIAIKIPQEYDEYKYNAWPFIVRLGSKIVCVYTKGIEHDNNLIFDVYSKYSTNGIVWSKERKIINTEGIRDTITGKGNDSEGNILVWNRVWGIGASNYHELFKSSDGIIFSKIYTKNSSAELTIAHIGDIISVPTVGLMALFNGSSTNGYLYGVMTSADDGVTWTINVIESGLTRYDGPVEMSAAYIENGQILAMGRREALQEGSPYVMFQLQSADYGSTWQRMNTNIDDISSSTPSLLYDINTDTLTLFYINRSYNTLKKRESLISNVWDNPLNWTASTDIHTMNTADGGQANATVFNGEKIVAEYAGSLSETGIYVTIV